MDHDDATWTRIVCYAWSVDILPPTGYSMQTLWGENNLSVIYNLEF